ncbi:cellulose biosynthesis cyclic di-GMP-binding regulatory protein BcsB [Mycolicibacterium porcinum]|uniref:cellulose biosynthesis cyclic di-GMP-binding regulatory protein BcsB n=1 Tax=Mycolicibacterium porcinum TaxID=39693 RepID=UPI00257E487B|nr:cellulose biosynthesis cyclic di-GMP-binding regulatory protein BcsB [Mycolicibacterium porcinum]
MTVRISRLFAAALVVTAVTVMPGTAVAAPGDVPSLVSSPTLNLRTLGVPPDIALYGVNGSQTLTIPVPRGLVPAELAATVQLPVNIRGGTLEVTQDQRVVSRVPLPPDQAQITIPLAGARVVENAVTVQLTSYLTVPEGYCAYDPTNPLRLIDSDVRFTGIEQSPTVIADFLPPVLSKLTLFVPPDPSQSESDAALRISTAVVARYGAQRPAIDIVTTDGGPVAPPQPLERQVIVREGDPAGLSLQGPNVVPALLISGPAGEVTNQARLLSSDISQLAVQSKAVVGPLSNTPQLPSDHTTIRQLGQPGVNATALVNPRVTVPLDQTRLGRAAHNVRVHLQGSYTPLPASIAGQVVVSIGGQTIDRWPTEASGRIDRWIDVPDRLLQRYTNVDIAVQAAGNTGRCGEFQPITLTIDGETPVESTLAKPPVPAGFQSLPQALMPRVVVGMDPGFANLRRAVQILTGLQRLSSRPFDAEVRSIPDAVASANPALLISPDGWGDARIALPVAVDADGVITVENVDGSGNSSTLTLDPKVGFGSLQTVYTGGRSVLVATSSKAPQELDRLLSWLGGDVSRWSGLSGNAALAMPGRDPFTLTTPAAEPETATGPEHKSLRLWAGAGAVVLAALGAGLVAWRGRSRGTS